VADRGTDIFTTARRFNACVTPENSVASRAQAITPVETPQESTMTELFVHTELLNKGAIAANRRIFALDRHPIDGIGVSHSRTEDRSDLGRLTTIRQTIASGASAFFRRFLATIYESRRKKAAIEPKRLRHLIYDPRDQYSPWIPWMKTISRD
jgi:hypothetical protein